ncbi:MAG: hypothetical protein KAJ24_00690, partial [Candidatus Aenigmarchaeota archaeon]|nr:hypothetical protein [Candidatus Aenigmarchaeota archaeon]
RNTTDMKARWYNTTFNSWLPYHNNGSDLAENHIFVKTKPVMFDEVALTNPGGWGGWFYFNVTVDDEDLDNVTVKLYARKTGAGAWGATRNQTTLYSPVNESIIIPWKPTADCSNIGEWEYYLEATDTRMLVSETDPHNFTMEKDNVTIILNAGDGGTVWRNTSSDDLLLSLNITDSDRNNLPLASGYNARFWVTENASEPDSWDIGKDTTTTAQGVINYNFLSELPTLYVKCNYTVGVQEWAGGIYNDTCYFDTNSSEYSLSIYSDLRPQITNMNGTGYLRGDLATIRGFVSDDCGFVEGVDSDYSLNNSPNIYPCTSDENSGWVEGDGWYNGTWSSASKPYGLYNITQLVSKPFYANNKTDGLDSLFLGANPSISTPSLDHNLGGWGEEYQFYVSVTDYDLNTNNVTL